MDKSSDLFCFVAATWHILERIAELGNGWGKVYSVGMAIAGGKGVEVLEGQAVDIILLTRMWSPRATSPTMRLLTWPAMRHTRTTWSSLSCSP